jgi:hypothetical protein
VCTEEQKLVREDGSPDKCYQRYPPNLCQRGRAHKEVFEEAVAGPLLNITGTPEEWLFFVGGGGNVGVVFCRWVSYRRRKEGSNVPGGGDDIVLANGSKYRVVRREVGIYW